ncbi:MAG: YihY/virulence factor BrkB family protein [Mobilicoccus sp.]|nr:YihY/virulence factor BrkB family protein [Mobilicoccus sp.]
MAYAANPERTPPRRVRARRLLERAGSRVLGMRIVRAGMRYHFGRAQLFAGGVAWSAVISITAIVTVAVNVGRAFLGSNQDIFGASVSAVNELVPGLIDDGANGGLIQPDALVVDSFWSPVTIASMLVLAWSALSVMTGLRKAIRAMFGLGGAPLPFHIGKWRDALGFLFFAVALVLSSTLSTAVSIFGGPILEWLQIEDGVTGWLLTAGAVLAVALIDALVFALLFRVTAAVKVVRRDLVMGSVLGAAGASLLRWAGNSVVGVVQDPVLASLAAAATLMIVVNVAVRLVLIVAAWTANPPKTRFPVMPVEFRHAERPNYVTLSAPHTLEWPYHEVTGSLLPSDPVGGVGNVPDDLDRARHEEIARRRNAPDGSSSEGSSTTSSRAGRPGRQDRASTSST